MIIRSVEVENWRCIQRVHLQDLPLGVVVVHGPNRSGKSSFFEALRCCLYEYDHSTAKLAKAGVIPRSTKATPRVVIEFEVGGTGYRISKVFSKGKEGGACLESWNGSSWVIELREPKEASRKVRELLLGGDKKKAYAGINQLLWLPQGRTELPSNKELDETLEQDIENVLGALVTNRDLEFRAELEKRYSRLYAASGTLRSNSPVEMYRVKKTEIEKRLAELNQELARAEGLVQEFADIEGEIRRINAEVTEARTQVSSLEEEKEKSRGRREAFRKAEEAFRSANERVQETEVALGEYAASQAALQAVEDEVRNSEKVFDGINEELENLSREHTAAQDLARRAREADDNHRGNQAELTARRNLLDLARTVAELERKNEEGSGYEKEAEDYRKRLAEVVAPSEDELKALRETAEEIRGLNARLEAAGIRLLVHPEQELTFKIDIDREPPRTGKITPKKPRDWFARQKIEAKLTGFGTIKVSRGKEALEIEDVAKRLREKEAQYQQQIESWGEDSSKPDVLDILTKKRFQREGWDDNLNRALEKLDQVAPDGLSAVRSQIGRMERKRTSVTKQNPALINWSPDEEELIRLESEFERESARLANVRREADKRSEELESQVANLRTDLENAREDLTRRRTSRDHKQGQLSQWDLERLRTESAEAEKKKKNAEDQMAKTALTEAERTIGKRLEIAEEVLQKREDRLTQRQTRLSECRGELRHTEGLHTERISVEQAFNVIENRLEEEELDAEAYFLIRQLFDECRDACVQETMLPVAERVVSWVQHLGLGEYGAVSFAEGYIPDGLVLNERGTGAEVIPINKESFGTKEQITVLVSLALGNLLAQNEPQVAIFDDPLAHTDPAKHERMLDILKWASEGTFPDKKTGQQLGRLQIFILTCHPGRFDYLPGATQIDFLEARSAHTGGS